MRRYSANVVPTGGGERIAAGAPAPPSAGGEAWRRSLLGVRTALAQLQTRLAAVQAELADLGATEAARKLTPAEAQRGLESAGLLREGAALREEFERLRGAPRRRD